MPIVYCKSCSKKIRAPASAVGKAGKCPRCNANVCVPAIDEEQPGAPAARSEVITAPLQPGKSEPCVAPAKPAQADPLEQPAVTPNKSTSDWQRLLHSKPTPKHLLVAGAGLFAFMVLYGAISGPAPVNGPYYGSRSRPRQAPEDLSGVGGLSPEQVRMYQEFMEQEALRMRQAQEMAQQWNDIYAPPPNPNGGGIVEGRPGGQKPGFSFQSTSSPDKSSTVCGACRGTGHMGMACPACRGSRMSGNNSACMSCKGRGFVECLHCWGTGHSRARR